ncbi:MAG TPA: chloride channel protein [Gemmatimonadales bacterium]|nr:chloride channel protein [Gemmatimonadales bacterium]
MISRSRIVAWQRAVGRRLRPWVQRLVKQVPGLADESTILVLFAVAIGTAVGITVVLFYKLIDVIQEAALVAAASIHGVGGLSILVVVLIGMVLVYLLVKYGTGDSPGQNIPDVSLAVAKRGGIVHTFPVTIKTIAASILIGTGGSVGAEGPVAVVGSALGSRIGRFFHSGSNRLTVLVACGGAAGISAAFNAPIGGVFFGLEEILGSFSSGTFPPVLISSVIAAAISRAAFGNSPVIRIPYQYAVGRPVELILYALLGIACGVVGVMYSQGTHRAGDFLKRFGSRWNQILVAGLIIGGLDIVFRASLWGHGHEALSLSIIGQHEAYFLVALAFAKLIATAFTISAGRAGGVFTPAIFIGATLGGGLAVAAKAVFPAHFTIAPEAFALVGMAGLIAGATHAPLTAIMIVFEMSNDYQLILPLMVCGAIAYVTAKRINPYSIYSEWLHRRGEQLHFGRDTAVLERLTVASAFNKNPHVISEDASVPQILEALGESSQTEFPVLDDELHLVGMITYNDLRTVLSQMDTLTSVIVAADVAQPEVEQVHPEDTLRTALQRLAVRGGHSLPVVETTNGGKLLGLISRAEIFAAYDRELLKQTEQAEGH